MRKYYCQYIDEVLTVYTLNEDGSKKIISTKHDDIIEWISVISLFDTYAREEGNNIELFNDNERKVSITIEDCPNFFSREQNEEIKNCIGKVHENGFVMKKPGLHLSKPKRRNDSFIVKMVIPLVLVDGISAMSLSPYQMRSKKNSERKVFDGIPYIASNVLPHEEIPAYREVIVKANDDSLHNPVEEHFYESIEEKKEIVNTEPIIEQEEKKDIVHEKESLMSYFNTDSIELVDRFLGEFVNTMSEYGSEYTVDDVCDIFYECSNVSLDEKIEYVENVFDLNDANLDSVAATLIAEGVGFGGKYIDVYAATTTALNHLQFPIWVTSISNVRGEKLGHNIYGHTCYAPQFNAYGSYNYYTFLGNHDLTGYTAVIDALYLYSKYGLILHNYCQFRGAWVDVPNGKIYEAGGNKYLDALKAEDRVVETVQKNNSIM